MEPGHQNAQGHAAGGCVPEQGPISGAALRFTRASDRLLPLAPAPRLAETLGCWEGVRGSDGLVEEGLPPVPHPPPPPPPLLPEVAFPRWGCPAGVPWILVNERAVGGDRFVFPAGGYPEIPL